jgi:hypothetical protein
MLIPEWALTFGVFTFTNLKGDVKLHFRFLVLFWILRRAYCFCQKMLEII